MRNLMAMLTALLFGVATGGAGVVVLKGLFGEWGAFFGKLQGNFLHNDPPSRRLGLPRYSDLHVLDFIGFPAAAGSENGIFF